MSFTKKRFMVAIALMSVLALLAIGVPFSKFSDIAFADLYGGSSTSSQGVNASVSSNGDGTCTVNVNGNTIVVGSGSGLGSGGGGFTVVKSVPASERAGYWVIQVNNPDNTVAFTIYINLTTGGCSAVGL